MKEILRSAACRAAISLLLFLLDWLDQLHPSACADALMPSSQMHSPLCHSEPLLVVLSTHFTSLTLTLLFH